jgi:hypothetical protein
LIGAKKALSITGTVSSDVMVSLKWSYGRHLMLELKPKIRSWPVSTIDNSQGKRGLVKASCGLLKNLKGRMKIPENF